MTTPILRAIEVILELSRAPTGPSWSYTSRSGTSEAVWVIDYRGDESALVQLWGLKNVDDTIEAQYQGDGPVLDELSAVSRVVLIDRDDGKIAGQGQLATHVSALDWAIAASSALIRRRPAGRDDRITDLPSIDVLDLRRLRNSPWKLNEAQRDDLSATNVRYFTGAVAELGQLGIALKTRGRPPAKRGPFRRYFKRWAFALGEAATRESHHRLNNSIGPLFLAAGIQDNALRRAVLDSSGTAADPSSASGDLLLRGALLRAFEWSRRARTPARVSTVSAFSAFSAAAREELGELRMLVLDDQALEGWVALLTNYFGVVNPPANLGVRNGFRCVGVTGDGPPVVSLWVATAPDGVLSKLEERARGSNPRLERLHFTVVPAEMGACINEVLFLDLRLFAWAEDSRRTENEFFTRVDSMHRLRSRGRVQAAAGSSSGSSISRLTSLARLISNIDFTYPVVLWSSTGQREVVEVLKYHSAIYTGLEKPRFDSYTDSAERFYSALTDCAAWIGNQIQAYAYFWGVVSAAKNKASLPTVASHPYAEIYIDESGRDNQPMSVGALIHWYRCESDAAAIHEEMASLRFEDPNSRRRYALTFHGNDRLPKKLNPNLRQVVAGVYTRLLRKYGVESAFVEDSTGPCSMDGIRDWRYLVLLSSVLRLSLCSLVPGRTLRVYVATRNGVCGHKSATPNSSMVRDIQRLYDKWGVLGAIDEIEDRRGGWAYQVRYSAIASASAVFPTANAMEYAEGVFHTSQLKSAVGVTLSYGEHGPIPAQHTWQTFWRFYSTQQGLGTPSPFEQLFMAQPCRSSFSLANDTMQKVYPQIDFQPNYRNQQYCADEMTGAPDALDAYIAAGVIDRSVVIQRRVNSAARSTDGQLLGTDCMKANALGELTRALLLLRDATQLTAASGLENDTREGNLRFLGFVASHVGSALSADPAKAAEAYGALLRAERDATASLGRTRTNP